MLSFKVIFHYLWTNLWYKLRNNLNWLRASLVDRDDAGDFVAELLEEWYAEVDKIIYDNYIQRQLVPYTILQAKDAILQIMEVCWGV